MEHPHLHLIPTLIIFFTLSLHSQSTHPADLAAYCEEAGIPVPPEACAPGGQPKGSSQYRGVSWHERSGRWEVRPPGLMRCC